MQCLLDAPALQVQPADEPRLEDSATRRHRKYSADGASCCGVSSVWVGVVDVITSEVERFGLYS